MEAYYKGRHLLTKGRPEDLSGALEALQSAVAAAPDFAPAQAALAEALMAGRPASAPAARTHADAALRSNPFASDAHLVRARVALLLDWDWELADRHLTRATALAPGDSATHASRAAYLMTLGRWAEAEEEVLIARALDPLSALLHGDVAMLYFYTQDAVALLEASERLLTLEPENRLAPSLKLQSLSWLGRWEDYRSQASLLLKGAPWLDAATGRSKVPARKRCQTNTFRVASFRRYLRLRFQQFPSPARRPSP
jgi:hypothetical protein